MKILKRFVGVGMKAGAALVAILSVSAGALAYVSVNGLPATVSNALSGANSELNLASSGGLAKVEVNESAS